MPHSSTQRGKRLFSLTVTILIVTGCKAISLQNSFHSGPSVSHIFRNYPLYNKDTALLNSRDKPDALARKGDDLRSASGFIRRERNGDLVIAIPTEAREKYKIRFFDDERNFLFEVRQIRDPMLIVEKYNFRHTGLFQYELYRENMLIERSTFLIRKD